MKRKATLDELSCFFGWQLRVTNTRTGQSFQGLIKTVQEQDGNICITFRWVVKYTPEDRPKPPALDEDGKPILEWVGKLSDCSISQTTVGTWIVGYRKANQVLVFIPKENQAWLEKKDFLRPDPAIRQKYIDVVQRRA